MTAGEEVSVLQHVKSLLDQMDLRYQQRFEAQTSAINAALQASKEAVIKAEMATEKRFEAVNEFRQTLSDQATTFVSRAEFDQRSEGVNEKMQNMQGRLDKTEGRSGGFAASWGVLLGAASLISVVIAIIIKFL